MGSGIGGIKRKTMQFKRLFWISFIVFVTATGVFGQARGAIHDEEAYENLPRIASFASSAY